MEKIKVSAIVPVYNVEKYLEPCLHSLVNQSLKDIEIIVVNDGATDNSGSIIEKYKKIYDNITVINQENSGLSSARNSGIKIAKGKYIMFIDSDDFVDLDIMERFYNKAEKYQCPLIICDLLLYWNEEKKRIYNNLKENEEKIYKIDELYKIMLMGKLNCQVMNKLYRRDIWEKANLTFEEGRYYEDIIPSFKVIKEYKEAMFINDTMYKYRMREGSITATASPKKIRDIIRSIKIAREFAQNNSGIEKLNIDAYIMSFNITYGLYALELDKTLSKDESLIDEIRNDIKLDYKITNVINNRKISMKTKIKYCLYRLHLFKYI